VTRAGLALAAAVAAVLLQPVAAGADAASYAAAVQQARSYVQEGLHGREGAAGQALGALEPEVAPTQPAVVADLTKDPPDYADADVRLAAIAAALGQPGEANPAQARAQVSSILAESRYDGLRGGQSLWDRFWGWVLSTIFNWLSSLPFGNLPHWTGWAVLAVIGAASAVVALLIVRSGWSRAGRALEAVAGAVRARSVDHFAEADRLAAEADWAGALRALVAGVANTVGDRPYWDTSPLTVRELFRGSGRLEQLRPLLLQFELAVYGHRPVDEEAYRRAAELARPFRQATAPAEEEAA
jgi:hypothetical protein